MLEKDIRKQIVDALKKSGYNVYQPPHHLKQKARTAKGWPDVVGVKNQTMLAIEVKGPSGHTTHTQNNWLAVLDKVPGITAMVVTPANVDAAIDLIVNPASRTWSRYDHR